ncbi:MAG: hypothetical protein P8J45_07675 [Phycisphaerales bacterium]|jgi:hypothetical protein|nr:hypothetical protein [Phycisphaerales bacterium]
MRGFSAPEASDEENTMTTTNDNPTLSIKAMSVATWMLNRLDLRLLTLIGAVSCAAGTIGLHC